MTSTGQDEGRERPASVAGTFTLRTDMRRAVRGQGVGLVAVMAALKLLP